MDQPTEDRTKKREGTPEDILKKLDAIDKKLDGIGTQQDAHNKRFDQIDKALVIHSRNISTLQADVTALKTDVAALPTKDDLAAMEERLIGLSILPGEFGCEIVASEVVCPGNSSCASSAFTLLDREPQQQTVLTQSMSFQP